MEQFETKSNISKDTLKELKPHLTPPLQSGIELLGMILCIYLCFMNVKYLILWLAFALYFAFLFFIGPSRNIKLILKRIQENTGVLEYETTTSFGEESLKLFNHATNGTTHMQYAHFRRFIETKNFYALFTKTQQIVLVNKSEIDQAQKREAFLLFIDIHCINIKKKIY